MKETVKLILEQIKMLERTYDFAVGETGLRMDSDKEEILKALRAFTKKVEQTQSLEQFEKDMEREINEPNLSAADQKELEEIIAADDRGEIEYKTFEEFDRNIKNSLINKMTLITRLSPLTKTKKIDLNLDNIKYILSDGSGYYIARKRGRNSYFFGSHYYKDCLNKFDGYDDEPFKYPGYDFLLNDDEFIKYLTDNCSISERDDGCIVFIQK